MAEGIAFQLIVQHDENKAWLKTVQAGNDSYYEPGPLMEDLAQENVRSGIKEDVIQDAFARLAEIEQVNEAILIAEGTDPVHGKDGSIDFKVDVSGHAAYRGVKSDDEKVDFREAVQVVSVKPGELLANLIPPTDGTPGSNLAGKPIQAKAGKPAKIRSGEGVEFNEAENTFTATTEGRPIFSNNILSVSACYVVPGDVDFNTGNVKFNGHVVVQGNVQDDFNIEADSVEVEGVIGACNITCQKLLIAKGGINGRERASIEVKGDADIKYINQAKFIVLGKLFVHREVVNSTIWCRGQVKAQKIIGGQCIALGGIDSNILGSELGVQTVLEPGINFEVRALEQKMEPVAEEIASVIRPVQNFFGERQRYKQLPDEKKDQYRQAFEKFLELKEAYLGLQEERDEILFSEDFDAVKQAVAREMIYPDVMIRTDLCMRHLQKPVTGPVAMVEDIDSGSIRPKTFHPGKGVVEDSDPE